VSVPRIVHAIWLDPLGAGRPAWVDRNLLRLAGLNDGYDVRLHGRLPADLEAELPEDCHPSTAADLLRLHVLAEQGGWYLDADIWPLRPLAEAERAWGFDALGQRVYCGRQDHP